MKDKSIESSNIEWRSVEAYRLFEDLFYAKDYDGNYINSTEHVRYMLSKKFGLTNSQINDMGTEIHMGKMQLVSKTDILRTEHNQCDVCLKQFATALGFHQHYPQCVDKQQTVQEQ